MTRLHLAYVGFVHRPESRSSFNREGRHFYNAQEFVDIELFRSVADKVGSQEFDSGGPKRSRTGEKRVLLYGKYFLYQ